MGSDREVTAVDPARDTDRSLPDIVAACQAALDRHAVTGQTPQSDRGLARWPINWQINWRLVSSCQH
jgi:hypothetical protein